MIPDFKEKSLVITLKHLLPDLHSEPYNNCESELCMTYFKLICQDYNDK